MQLERLTRRKSDGREHPDLAIDEVLSIAGATRNDVDVVCFSRSEFPTIFYRNIRGVRWIREKYRKYVEGNTRRYMPPEFLRHHTAKIDDIFDVAKFRRAGGFRDDAEMFFYNHHESHALAPLFYTDWNDALLVTADGGGDTVNYSHRHFADGALTTIYGGEECLLTPLPTDSLGHAYETVTGALGFIPRRHEGKLTGLAAFGQPVLAGKIGAHFSVDDTGRVRSDFRDFRDMHDTIRSLAVSVSREDAAASIQQVLEDTMLRSVERLLQRHKARHLGLAGGVFANVRLNRVLAERLPLDEIFVFPGDGRRGHAGGRRALLSAATRRIAALARRSAGGCATCISVAITPARSTLRSKPPPACAAPAKRRSTAPPSGSMPASSAPIYTGRMEYGPRALGARSILANPSRRETHDLLNQRLARSEFMPFAPVITDEKAATVFDVNPVNAYACRFMTITCNVKPEWRERIAAVVHVDGSARPQTIARDTNPLYYDILTAFERDSGLPVLVNTSFNVHEEPIVNKPSECVKALLDGRIDFIVTTQGIYERTSPRPGCCRIGPP